MATIWKRQKYLLSILWLIIIIWILIYAYIRNKEKIHIDEYSTTYEAPIPEEYNKDFCINNCKAYLDDDWSRENNPESNLENCYIGKEYPSGIIRSESVKSFNESICKNHCNTCAGLTCTTEYLDIPKSCKRVCSQETKECSRVNCERKLWYWYIVYTCEYIDWTSFEKEFEYPQYN